MFRVPVSQLKVIKTKQQEKLENAQNTENLKK
jgi:hypothetical protein